MYKFCLLVELEHLQLYIQYKRKLRFFMKLLALICSKGVFGGSQKNSQASFLSLGSSQLASLCRQAYKSSLRRKRAYRQVTTKSINLTGGIPLNVKKHKANVTKIERKITSELNLQSSLVSMSVQQLGKWAIGIRREDKNRWERRAPLAPSHVKELVKRGITVIVQPSSLRTYSDKQYAEVAF